MEAGANANGQADPPTGSKLPLWLHLAHLGWAAGIFAPLSALWLAFSVALTSYLAIELLEFGDASVPFYEVGDGLDVRILVAILVVLIGLRGLVTWFRKHWRAPRPAQLLRKRAKRRWLAWTGLGAGSMMGSAAALAAGHADLSLPAGTLEFLVGAVWVWTNLTMLWVSVALSWAALERLALSAAASSKWRVLVASVGVVALAGGVPAATIEYSLGSSDIKRALPAVEASIAIAGEALGDGGTDSGGNDSAGRGANYSFHECMEELGDPKVRFGVKTKSDVQRVADQVGAKFWLSAEDAHDIALDALLSVCLDDPHRNGDLAARLYRSAVNTAIDGWRHQGVQRRNAPGYAQVMGCRLRYGDPEEAEIQKARARAADIGLSALSADEELLVIEHIILGKTYEEMSATRGGLVSPEAVRKRTSRALAKARKHALAACH